MIEVKLRQMLFEQEQRIYRIKNSWISGKADLGAVLSKQFQAERVECLNSDQLCGIRRRQPDPIA